MSGCSVPASFCAASSSAPGRPLRTRPWNRPRDGGEPLQPSRGHPRARCAAVPWRSGYVRKSRGISAASPACPPDGGAVWGWPAYSRDLCRTRRVITCRTSCSGCSRLSTPSMPARPVMLAIAGDSAAGKTTITRGLVEALGRRARRSASMTTTSTTGPNAASCRSPRCTPTATTYRSWSSTCSYSPGASRSSSRSTTTTPGSSPPVLVEPRQFVIIEGLLPLHTKLARVCFDATVYLDPPEEIRRAWKVSRDTAERGYTAEAVLAELERREAGVRGVHPAAARVRGHRHQVRADPGPRRAGGHAAVRRADATADDQAPRPGRRGARGYRRRLAAGHPPQARARRGRPPGRRAAHTRGRGPGRQRGGGEGHLVQARRPATSRPRAWAGPGKASAPSRWPSPSCCSCTTCSTQRDCSRAGLGARFQLLKTRLARKSAGSRRMRSSLAGVPLAAISRFACRSRARSRALRTLRALANRGWVIRRAR